jgi:uncharacterized protein involved in exopolysaccharide biosynthesis
MSEPFDAFGYISYLRARWRSIALSCCVAVAIALTVSLAMTRKYTATAKIVIDPPAGADPRSALAISPIYLESLKTYEEFAASDSLFLSAIDHFGLRVQLGSRPVESLKRAVLKVGIVRNTRILEISVTLPDARLSHALALFLAEESVKLNRSLASRTDQDLLQGVERQAADARTRLAEVDSAWAKLLSAEPVEHLQTEIQTTEDLRSNVEQQLLSARLELAAATEREKQSPSDASLLREEESNTRARLAELQKQIQDLDRDLAAKEKLLAERQVDTDRLSAGRESAQKALATAEDRLSEARGAAGFRGERLTVIDPGIVPERPSSPNIPLNVMAALLLGIVIPMLYFMLEMSYEQQRAGSRRTVFQALARARDE